jgi:fucose permease
VDNARGPVYPLIIDIFSLTKSNASYVFSLASFVSFIVTVLVNKWLPRFGLIGSTKISLSFHSIALILMGSSAFFENGYSLFLLGCVFLGIGVGLQSITVNLIVSKSSTALNRRKLFSGLHSMYGAAALLSPFVLGIFIRLGFDWRYVFLFLSLLPIIVLITFIKNQEIEFEEPFELSRKSFNKSSIRLGVLLALYVSTEIIVGTRLVLFLKDELQMSVEQGSMYLTLFFLLLLTGRLSFTFMNLKLKSYNLLQLSLCGTLICFGLAFTIDPRFLALSGLTMSYFFPCSMDFISNNYKDSETIISIVMNFVGLFLIFAHLAFGVISDIYGVSLAMKLGILLSSLVLYLLHLESKTLRNTAQ